MHLTVAPRRAPIDEPVIIRLDGLEPGCQVSITSRMVGYIGRTWSAEATFAADAAGTVDLARDAPLAGSYQGVDQMGLFWSMRPEPGPDIRFDPDTLLTVTLTAALNDGNVAESTVERQILADGVARRRVRGRGLVGSYFRPKADGAYPGVLVMGGSGGGLRGSYWQAALLARHGFATLALAYFKMESLPESLTSIPLEYFETAIAWLLEQPGVVGDGVGVIGTSRGGELVLLLGATFPRSGQWWRTCPVTSSGAGSGRASAARPRRGRWPASRSPGCGRISRRARRRHRSRSPASRTPARRTSCGR